MTSNALKEAMIYLFSKSSNAHGVAFLGRLAIYQIGRVDHCDFMTVSRMFRIEMSAARIFRRHDNV